MGIYVPLQEGDPGQPGNSESWGRSLQQPLWLECGLHFCLALMWCMFQPPAPVSTELGRAPCLPHLLVKHSCAWGGDGAQESQQSQDSQGTTEVQAASPAPQGARATMHWVGVRR